MPSNDSTPGNNPGAAANILGLSTDELANLSVQEIVGNETAIKMLMHYYKVLSQENTSLRTDVNTLNTYVKAYTTKKTDSNVGAILQAAGALFIGLGTNMVTGAESTSAGWLMLVGGVAAQFAGFYLVMREPK